MTAVLDLLNQGLLGLGLGAKALILFGFVQISMMGVTLYLHRDQAHRAIDLHPALRHFFRLWIWLTSGMVTREWVAVHRKHHAMCEQAGDPHSPVMFGLTKVLTQGAELYRVAARDADLVAKYGRGTPDDWLERKVYARYSVAGIYITLALNVLLFGVIGITMFAVQMMAMPVFAAGVINGLGHARGYRNFESADAATNLTPIALLIGGEELHNNHHAFPASAKFSVRGWEFDIGWLYITALRTVGLCSVRRVAPRPLMAPAPRAVDIETLRAVLVNRMHVLRDYTRAVTLPTLDREARTGRDGVLRAARNLLVRRPQLLDEAGHRHLAAVLAASPALRTVHEYRQQLVAVWEQANVSNDQLVRQLKEWCARAEASGIEALQEFSARLRGYLPEQAAAAA
jgi:stearoyl-CoA desaturase (delta-9 desaturase)